MSQAKLKIGIVGKGAIGGLLAMNCQQLCLDYRLLLREQNSPGGYNNDLAVENLTGAVIPLTGKQNSLATAVGCELIILPIKSYQIAPTLNTLAEHFANQVKTPATPKPTIILLHNGMGGIESVNTLLPHHTCIAATTSYGAFKPNENLIKQTGGGDTHLGWVTDLPDNHKQIENTLEKLLPPSHWHQDIYLALWNKLAINSVINPLTAIHYIKNGQLADEKFNQIIQDICAEVLNVMAALGYDIEQQALINNVYKVVESTANNYSSMHQDIHHGRKTEIEFINGYIVNKANELGIAVPINHRLLNQVLELESK